MNNQELRHLLQAYLNRDDFEEQFGAAEYQIAVLLLLVEQTKKISASIAKLEKTLEKIANKTDLNIK